MSKSSLSGRILRIERASLHDGDGLRTVVFVKGCPLKCKWCSTPESQKSEYEFGLHKDACTGCGLCVKNCPAGALTMVDGRPSRNMDICTHCLKCVRVCPNNVWLHYGDTMTSDQLLEEIAKDEIFFFHTGGGVTFSGGEPLAQSDFIAEVIRGCNERAIHTAMETSLFAPWENVQKVFSLLNFSFVDIKHMDPVIHKEITGVDNALILENLKRIGEGRFGLDIVARIPVIPGINDSAENLTATVKFCDTVKNIKAIEILPYHRLGMETYRNLGIEYGLPEIMPPSAETMEGHKKLMEDVAQRVKILIG